MEEKTTIERKITDYISFRDDILIIGTEKDPVSSSELEKAVDYYEGTEIIEVHLRFEITSNTYHGILRREEIDLNLLH